MIVVACSDDLLDGAGAVFDKLLTVAQPDARSVGQAGNL